MLIESLETRRLLAFTTADYFPAGVGGVTNYTGVVDAEAATAQRTTDFDVVGNKNVIQWTTVIDTGTQTIGARQYFSLASGGLYLHRFSSIADAETEAIITPGLAIQLLRQDAPTVGGVVNIPSIESEVLINAPPSG